jgi:hypothetical protein
VNDSKYNRGIRTGLIHLFGILPARGLMLALLSVWLLTGCSTTATYQPRTTAGPAKPSGYPVLVYAENMTVPRPSEVIGTVSAGGGQFTLFGGSVESEMKMVMRTAREKGADAIRMKSMEQPDFSHANYRLAADLLRYTNQWETVAVPEQAFAEYLETNQRSLDPIEGVWNGYEGAPFRFGIMRSQSIPGRDFVGFILNTGNPTWRRGYKKMDIRRGPQPGTYLLDYYLDNFSKRATTVILGNDMAFSLTVPTSEAAMAIITCSKSR